MLFNMNEKLAYSVYEIDETVKLLTQLIGKNKGYAKEGTKIKTAFENVKAKMVVTTGDAYVSFAEPQLREKLGELYANIAGNFKAPSSSQLENLELIKQLYDSADSEFKALKVKHQANYLKQATANSIPFVLKTFDEFVKE